MFLKIKPRTHYFITLQRNPLALALAVVILLWLNIQSHIFIFPFIVGFVKFKCWNDQLSGLILGYYVTDGIFLGMDRDGMIGSTMHMPIKSMDGKVVWDVCGSSNRKERAEMVFQNGLHFSKSKCIIVGLVSGHIKWGKVISKTNWMILK